MITYRLSTDIGEVSCEFISGSSLELQGDVLVGGLELRITRLMLSWDTEKKEWTDKKYAKYTLLISQYSPYRDFSSYLPQILLSVNSALKGSEEVRQLLFNAELESSEFYLRNFIAHGLGFERTKIRDAEKSGGGDKRVQAWLGGISHILALNRKMWFLRDHNRELFDELWVRMGESKLSIMNIHSLHGYGKSEAFKKLLTPDTSDE